MTRADRTATYVYCLIHRPGPRPPSAAGVPPGLPGAGPVRLLDAGAGLWMAVADAPLRHYGSEPVERGLRDLGWVSARAVGHEAVVEHFARAGTVVPLKLFTLFASDERAVEHIRRSRPRLDRLVARVAGRQEWGVRMALDETRALRAARRRAGPAGARGGAGTSFLVGRQREREAARRLAAEARAEAERTFADLARRADDARRRTPPQAPGGLRLVLDAAFLVPAARARAFRTAVRARGARLARGGLALTLSGPWPPYNFVSDPR